MQDSHLKLASQLHVASPFFHWLMLRSRIHNFTSADAAPKWCSTDVQGICDTAHRQSADRRSSTPKQNRSPGPRRRGPLHSRTVRAHTYLGRGMQARGGTDRVQEFQGHNRRGPPRSLTVCVHTYLGTKEIPGSAPSRCSAAVRAPRWVPATTAAKSTSGAVVGSKHNQRRCHYGTGHIDGDNAPADR